MLKEPRQIGMADFSNKHDVVELTINWSDAVKDCEYIKIKIGKEEAVLRREHLMGFMFMIGTSEDQRALIPSKIEEVKMLERLIGITATKDIHKGEKINVRVSIPVSLGENYNSIK